jgi:hypothetical protein
MRIERTDSPPPLRYKARPEAGERVPVIGCYSEVMMHFGLAGKPIEVALVRNTYINGKPVPPGGGYQWVCQVYKNGQPFSAPILTGEGGFYEDDEGHYTYPDEARIPSESYQD